MPKLIYEIESRRSISCLATKSQLTTQLGRFEKTEGPKMSANNSIELRWIRLAIGMGIATSVVYPSLIFLPLSQILTITLAAAVGPLLGFASLGLYRFLRLHQPSVSAQLAAACNFLGGALFSTMLLVQLG